MTTTPLPPGPVAHDDEGLEVPQPSDRDLGDLIQLLEYGRRKGFVIGPNVRIGKITLQVRDLRQQRGRGKQEEPDPSIWEEHGYDGEGG